MMHPASSSPTNVGFEESEALPRTSVQQADWPCSGSVLRSRFSKHALSTQSHVSSTRTESGLSNLLADLSLSIEVFSKSKLHPALGAGTGRSDDLCPERMLLLAVRDQLAFVYYHCRSCYDRCWVPIDGIFPSPAYEFSVTVVVHPKQRLGLSLIVIDSSEHQPGGLFVYGVATPSLLAQWNERCQQCYPRDQLFPGDVIVGVQGECCEAALALPILKELQASQTSQILELQVVRASAARLFKPDEPLSRQLFAAVQGGVATSHQDQENHVSCTSWSSSETRAWRARHQRLQNRLERQRGATEPEELRMLYASQ